MEARISEGLDRVLRAQRFLDDNGLGLLVAESTFIRAGRLSASFLSADAAAMVLQAEPHEAALITAGLATNFLEAMRDAAKRLDEAVLARGTFAAEQIRATRCGRHSSGPDLSAAGK